MIGLSNTRDYNNTKEEITNISLANYSLILQLDFGYFIQPDSARLLYLGLPGPNALISTYILLDRALTGSLTH